MERYQVVGHLRLSPEGTVTSYADAQATVEALQRERDQWKEAFERSCDDTAYLKAALDAEREKVENLGHKIQSRGGLALIDDARAKAGLYDQLATQLTQLQALVRAIYQDLPIKRDWLDPVLEARMKATLGATTPAQTDEQRFIEACCERPHDCKWGGTGGCGYEGRKPKGGDGE